MVAVAEIEEEFSAVEMLIVDIFQIFVNHFHHLSGGYVAQGGTLWVWALGVLIPADVAVHIPLILLRLSLISFRTTECSFDIPA